MTGSFLVPHIDTFYRIHISAECEVIGPEYGPVMIEVGPSAPGGRCD